MTCSLGLLGALHETGHAMYDLGLPQTARPAVGRIAAVASKKASRC